MSPAVKFMEILGVLFFSLCLAIPLWAADVFYRLHLNSRTRNLLNWRQPMYPVKEKRKNSEFIAGPPEILPEPIAFDLAYPDSPERQAINYCGDTELTYDIFGLEPVDG